MARLQRKKISGGKKKKNLSAVTGEPGGTGNGKGANGPALAESSVREVRKQPAFVPKKAVGGPRSEPGKIRGTIDKSLQFLREVRVELKKVTWPSRKQTVGSTAVVLILVMIISLFLGVADIGLSSLIRVVLQ